MTMASVRMFWSLLLVMSTLALAKGSLEFKDCGSNQATINTINVSNCTKLPCQIKRGSIMHLNVSFTPSKVYFYFCC
uniref:MD-2-related lipid-recognition domain-containing protein n=1 Tax=Octopus bimaculoides TaxID=37653 RepID=A0A0L8FZ34_OCTBM